MISCKHADKSKVDAKTHDSSHASKKIKTFLISHPPLFVIGFSSIRRGLLIMEPDRPTRHDFFGNIVLTPFNPTILSCTLSPFPKLPTSPIATGERPVAPDALGALDWFGELVPLLIKFLPILTTRVGSESPPERENPGPRRRRSSASVVGSSSE